MTRTYFSGRLASFRAVAVLVIGVKVLLKTTKEATKAGISDHK